MWFQSKREQSDDMYVYHLSAYWYNIVRRASNIQWVRFMPFVLNYCEHLKFNMGYFWICALDAMALFTMHIGCGGFCIYFRCDRIFFLEKLKIKVFGTVQKFIWWAYSTHYTVYIPYTQWMLDNTIRYYFSIFNEFGVQVVQAVNIFSKILQTLTWTTIKVTDFYILLKL